MSRLNFESKEMFEYRFKRKPRIWTISEVHSLWLETKKINSKRRKEYNQHLNWIVENIKPNNGKGWTLYYSDSSFYKLGKDPRFGITRSSGYSESNRESKINSIIIHSETIDIGKKLNHLDKLISRREYVVKSHLDRLIEKTTMVKKMREDIWGGNGPRDVFVRIDGRLYLYKIEANSKIVKEIKENEIIDIF